MEENKNELALWVGILAIIGLFIFFMPDIERFLFGQAKKDKETGTEEKVKKEEQPVEPKKEVVKTTPTRYDCSLNKTESFYKQDIKYVYSYDKKGNTLAASETMTMVADNVDAYNQLKANYQKNGETINKLGDDFKKYYVSNTEYDDTNRTIKLTVNIKDYSKALVALNEYNIAHADASFDLNFYDTYDETEINMKSEGYTCE